MRDVQRVKMNIVRRRSVTDTSKRRRNNAASAGRTFLVNVYFNWVWDLFVNLRVDHNIPSSVERLEQHGLYLLSTDTFCWMIDEERERCKVSSKTCASRVIKENGRAICRGENTAGTTKEERIIWQQHQSFKEEESNKNKNGIGIG